ncbi:TSUP family transporter [Flavobacterium sp. '19STA2R22 D10 B1']|uniref:TSUP family transporter n=1 Tax=Flavobacterium aerium TaxID=3037261 RepID=UPI00278BBE92|nr:TSUP family transporter [Flavobacterium sp. '19STA2R22 D10 B1']
MENTLFPIFLKTDTFRFLIVGGGKIGLEKTETLLKQNPAIALTLVAKEISVELKKFLRKYPHIVTHERAVGETDFADIDFAIIATENTELNRQLKVLANEEGILVNVADQPLLCDFYLGSIVNKGNLKIAISTNGKSPVLARRLREHLEEAIPQDINDSIENLNSFRSKHKGDLQTKLTALNQATAVLGQSKTEQKEGRKYKKLAFNITVLFITLFIGYGLSTIVSFQDLQVHLQEIPNEFYGMLLIGFFAQMVDGAVGLGYGVTCATSMMLLGVRLPAISGSIHTAEMFSSAISGYSHYKFGNVNKKLLIWLTIPGVIGAVSGASLLNYLGTTYEVVTYSILSTYTMIIGLRLIVIAFRKNQVKQRVKHTGILGFSGGFFDAFGGGGWGPIVTSTLLAKGRKSRYVVGTVSLAEFFVTLAATITFFVTLGVSHWYIILGLIIGGSIAAPLAAKLAGKLPQKIALLLVAFLVIIFSIRMLMKII